jgi:hypothetical protein
MLGWKQKRGPKLEEINPMYMRRSADQIRPLAGDEVEGLKRELSNRMDERKTPRSRSLSGEG